MHITIFHGPIRKFLPLREVKVAAQKYWLILLCPWIDTEESHPMRGNGRQFKEFTWIKIVKPPIPK